ncbi:uncharacterized protein RAG0_04333 [Rhynchosporium agropyri]|uniref:Uncharacterized protein n=1 Tax=Rhynchosporium agropyri TaxID=914238 RepID=A0A1E1K8Q3_9HELO|nr:uncharacterized protein RAG0_04333 [Rhynchosporium agropyri]
MAGPLSIATRKTRSGFTIYIDDDDTPPPETGQGALEGASEAKEIKKEKEVIRIASSIDYWRSSDNEDLIAASQEVECQVMPKGTSAKEAINLASSSSYGGSSDNEDFITASQEVERQVLPQDTSAKNAINLASSSNYGGASDNEDLIAASQELSNYGGSSDNEDFIAASQELDLMHSSQVKASKTVVNLASSSVYGSSSYNDDLVLANQQMELMRSWVDAGIQMAIDEAALEARCGSADYGKEKDESSGAFGQGSRMSHTGGGTHSHKHHYRNHISIMRHMQPRLGMTIPGHQYTPTATRSLQSPGYYAQQHATYSSQSTNQNIQSHQPQGYYKTPPASHPPFLQSQAFGSSAPPQSSPTPGPYGMSAFHNRKTSQSSRFISTTLQPLAPASSNIPTPKKRIKAQVTGQPFILPPNQYLSWHELEQYYGPPRANHPTDTSHAVVRLAWLKTLKMNVPPFDRVWVAGHKKQEVEDTWAGLPASKRQIVEISALVYKYKTKVSVPCREVPADVLPLSFKSLLDQYFFVPERKLSGFADTVHKKALWVTALGLMDFVYRGHSAKDQEVAMLYYSKLPVVRRRAIEVKAKYLKVQLNPPNPTFKVFEARHCVHKKEDSTSKAVHESQRKTWLQEIGLYEEPFIWYPDTQSELGIAQQEETEVAWDDFGAEKRADIERRAAICQETCSWGASWEYIEKDIGFTASDGERYTQWLSAVGRPLQAGETRDSIWIVKSNRDRAAIWKLAVRMKNEIQERWDVKERAMRRSKKRPRTTPKVAKTSANLLKTKRKQAYKPRTGYATAWEW